MPYQAVWARLNVFDENGEATVVQRGQYIEDVDEVQLSQLATIGAIRFVDVQQQPLEDVAFLLQTAPIATDEEFQGDPDEAPVGFVDTSLGVPSGSPLAAPGPDETPLVVHGDDASGEQSESEDSDDSEPSAPARNATKAEWEAYAVSQGMSQEEAESATKTELQAKFG